MNKGKLTLQIVAAVIGCFLGTYIGQELLGGAALGWTVTGAIVAVFARPLFQTLFAWRQEQR
jgi:hypothetical protein